jgi:hypothetical protein
MDQKGSLCSKNREKYRFEKLYKLFFNRPSRQALVEVRRRSRREMKGKDEEKLCGEKCVL